MIKGTMNQLHNIDNPHQTSRKKVLTVCSAGLLRSPTAADLLKDEYGYNTRSCGTHDYALIPISEALIKWADEVVFVNMENYNSITDEAKAFVANKKKVLNVPDMYEWGNPELLSIISDQYKEAADGDGLK